MNISWFCIFHAKVRNKMRIIISPIFFLFQICYAAPDTPEIIDVHMHFQALPNLDIHGSEMSALQTMDRFNVQRSLLMPPPYTKTNQQNFYDIEDLRLVVRDHPDRFALLGGSTLNAMLHNTPAGNVDDPIRRRFINRAKEILALGAIGFGEISIHHVSIPAMGSQHGYHLVSPSHPLLQLLAEIAAEYDVPIDIHFDLVPADMPLPDQLRANANNPSILMANLEEFQYFLARNPKTKFIWSHVGAEPLLTRHPDRVKELLTQFPNLYMSFRLNRKRPVEAVAISPDGQVKPSWVALIEALPDRFMLGSDAFYDRGGIARGSSIEGFENLRALVASLSEPARSAISYQNAARLYRLPEPKK